MNRKQIYLILAIAGFIVPYWFFVSFLFANGLNGKLFMGQLFDTPISSFFAADLILSCLVFVRYLRLESARLSMRNSWLYILALLTVGLSLALPLFLYARERKLEETEAK